jgi:hypothetical protein
MTPEVDRQREPQTWPELRRCVLEEDYLAMSELQHRKRRARQTKHGIWLMPLVVVLLAPVVITKGPSLPTSLAILLISGGALTSYLLGARWERRWDELVRVKVARQDERRGDP